MYEGNIGVVKPKAKNLILDLLLASDGEPLAARDAILACRLFGLTENNARVTLARLAAESLIEGAGRGSYRLGSEALELAGEVATWRSAEQRIRPWTGAYVAVHAGALSRSDRSALKRRQRALDLLGFRELQRGLFLRPDNIERDVGAVRARLCSLGLEPQASVFLSSAWAAPQTQAIHALWDGVALNERYRQLRQQLEDWLTRSAELEPEEAARESFILGGKAIRQVVFDPWLPAPLVDETARHAFLDTVRRYDAAGRAIWQRIFHQHNFGAAQPDISAAGLQH